MTAGCYTLDLYCDCTNPAHEYGEFPHQYIHEHGSVCRTMARREGWKLHRDGRATCPKCRVKTRDALENGK